jgi:membrane protease YdiL (CAAX protease family)
MTPGVSTGATPADDVPRRSRDAVRVVLRASEPTTLLTAATVVSALVLLLSRFIGATTIAGRAEPVLVVIYAAVLVASVAAPVPRPASNGLPRWAVVAVGVAAVAAAPLVAGPALPRTLVAFALPLNVLAAASEEALFHRLLYGRLERFGAPLAVGATAAAFALIHLPLYGTASLPVDLGAGLLLSWQRWASGSWGAPALTHVVANVLASV